MDYRREKLPTTQVGMWRNPDVDPPPLGVKLNLLTVYGIAQYGEFQKDFHVGWDYCLKIPPEIKRKLVGL